MQTFLDITTLVFVGCVLIVGGVSAVALHILFKHAEKKSVATHIALSYSTIFLLLLLASLIRLEIL